LFRYLDEQAFRFNERENTDSGRFLKGIIGIIGRRLQYAKTRAAGLRLRALAWQIKIEYFLIRLRLP
jgi:hypothetical protein